MTHSRLKKFGAAAACAGVGAIAGIASSAAAPANSGKAGKAGAIATAVMPAPPGAVFFKLGGPAVHSVEIVPNQAGEAFDTVTQDSGTVKSVSGTSITITEGTDKATYATPTLTVAGDTTVERNFQRAKLADLQPGDHVDVTSTAGGGSDNVFAVDAQHWPPKPPKFMTKGGPLPPPSFAGSTVAAGVASGSTTTP